MNLNFNPFPILKTERLVLRQLNNNDTAAIKQLRSDERINEFIGRSGSITMDEAMQFIDMINDNIRKNQSMYWAITPRGDDTLIGTICFWNLSHKNNSAEMGYELSVAYQGKGLMQEAIASVIHFGFDVMELDIITALPDKRNAKSVQLLQRNNFLLDEAFNFATKEETGEQAVYYLLNKNPQG